MSAESLLKQLKPEEIAEIKTAFKEFDKDSNGYITSDEMHECLRRSHVSHDNNEILQVMKNMDSNRDGTVSFDEYMTFMAYLYTGQTPPAPNITKQKGKK
ncbi:unnamed protein product [Adineta ricciae]|uniref:EF-hand domain-containing protein n=1 Tax=Adineta ricciae TaxID=249248 RepID=A0A814JUF7_ADIRI|nr:unnamed protein product [Adineta ricciae]CAF1042712.1 unnamed protein product [Adineta ricciae]